MAAETDNQTAKFDLDGTEYEIPDILDLDIDEWIVVYDYCGLVLEDFAPSSPALAAVSVEVSNLALKAAKLDEGSAERLALEEELRAAGERFSQVRASLSEDEQAAEAERVRRLRHPAFPKAMFHIGYQRAHPKKTAAEVKSLVGKVKMTPQTEEDGAEGEDPTSTNGQPPLSERTRDDSPASLSLVSPPSSGTPDALPEPIGTPG